MKATTENLIEKRDSILNEIEEAKDSVTFLINAIERLEVERMYLDNEITYGNPTK
jgi:hypothetical protein